MFADNCIFSTQASDHGANRLMAIFDKYEQGSGQLVNISKSVVFFSESCVDSMNDVVTSITGITMVALGEKYLGLPTAVGRSTEENFEHI
jgi:hypothetical protein